jgi:hypothetical protein
VYGIKPVPTSHTQSIFSKVFLSLGTLLSCTAESDFEFFLPSFYPDDLSNFIYNRLFYFTLIAFSVLSKLLSLYDLVEYSLNLNSDDCTRILFMSLASAVQDTFICSKVSNPTVICQ